MELQKAASEAVLEIDEMETAHLPTEYEGLIPMLKRWFGASQYGYPAGMGGKIYGT